MRNARLLSVQKVRFVGACGDISGGIFTVEDKGRTKRVFLTVGESGLSYPPGSSVTVMRDSYLLFWSALH